MSQECTNERIHVLWCEFYVSNYMTRPCLFCIYVINIILSFAPRSSHWFSPIRFSDKKLVCVCVCVLALSSFNRTAVFLAHNFPWSLVGKVFLCLTYSTSQQVPCITAALPQATNTRGLLGRPPVVPVDWKSSTRAQNLFCFYTWKFR